MEIAEFQVGLALKGFASKLTVPNYRVKWGADFSPPKWMFCPKASAKHAQIWIFLGSNSLLGIHLSQQLTKFKIFYHLQSLLEAFMESICPKIGGLTVLVFAPWNHVITISRDHGHFWHHEITKFWSVITKRTILTKISTKKVKMCFFTSFHSIISMKVCQLLLVQ